MPVDEEMYKMKKMQQVINKQAQKYGKQPVQVNASSNVADRSRAAQFVDPMQNAMFMDEEDYDL